MQVTLALNLYTSLQKVKNDKFPLCPIYFNVIFLHLLSNTVHVYEAKLPNF